jgi:adenylyltransferase/sulfurtransferase
MTCSVQELKAKQDQGAAFVLIDVRTEEELEIVALPGALHVPLHDLDKRLPELDPHRDAEIIVMCHHGGRSAAAQDFLRRQGFTNVLNLVGGINAYAIQVDDSLATY